jgi:hypothetical protein
VSCSIGCDTHTFLDMCVIVKYQPLVESFVASGVQEEPEEFLSRTFDQAKDTAQGLFSEISQLPLVQQREHRLASLASSGLASSRIGQYSVMHDKAIFKHGLDHQTSRELQWM